MLSEIVTRTVIRLELEEQEAILLKQLFSFIPNSKLLNTQEEKLKSSITKILDQLV